MICGKVIYQSRTEANNAMKGGNGKNRGKYQSKNRLNTSYYCNECNGWHIASKCKKFTEKQNDKIEVNTFQSGRRKKKSSNKPLIVVNYSSKPISNGKNIH